MRRSRDYRTVFESTTRRSRALCRRKNRHAGLGAPLCRPASRSASCSTSRVRVQATRNPVTVLRFRCSHGTSRGELRRSAKGARPRPLYGKSRCPLPQRQSAHHLGQSQYPLRRTRGSLERFQSSPRRSLHPPLHSKTRLMGQPGGVVFQHFTKAMLARRQLLLSRRASGAVLEFIAFWNREKAHPFRWTFTGYPLQSGIEFEKAS